MEIWPDKSTALVLQALAKSGDEIAKTWASGVRNAQAGQYIGKDGGMSCLLLSSQRLNIPSSHRDIYDCILELTASLLH